MRVTFVSNYINHHQIPFCTAMYQKLGQEYCFIQTEPMEAERVQMGWGADFSALPWLRLYYEQPEACQKLIAESDVVLFGGVDDETYITKRLQDGKLTVRLSERIYKSGQWKAISPAGLKKKYTDHTQYRKKEVYLLCCGGYVASDFHIVRAYPGKMFRWGYFPAFQKQDIDALMQAKKERRNREGKILLLWAGRFIDWKHPEYAIMAAGKLKEKGCAFSLTMVGGGEREEQLKTMVQQMGLTEEVKFAGFQKPEEVRCYMEQADIYLFTSDYKEGWGAVLNEAMNSGCAVVANCGIGAVPFLVKPGKNALIYPNKGKNIFYKKLLELAEAPDKVESLGREAYRTISQEWNADIAAERLIPMLENLLEGKAVFEKNGILSKAPVIAPYKMYRSLLKGRT